MAASSNEFAHYSCELLSSLGVCVAKRMFGGHGISLDGLTLAIVADLGGGEMLWLKADDDSRAQFEAAGCQRFVYLAKGKAMGMNYYSAPEEAMESPQQMAPWARLALEAALRARKSKKTPVKTTRRVSRGPAPGRPSKKGRPAAPDGQ